MEIKVDFLADHPGAVPILTEWLFREWGHRSPDSSVERMASTLRVRMQKEKIPLALVAFRDGTPVGTVSLKAKEVETRPQYEYWLGTLFVAEPFRRMGVGSLLVRSIEEHARNLGVRELYLYTRHSENKRLYESLGWTEIECPQYRGRTAIIMKKELDA
ncbi:MAG: GNAT family N-acetyltransferase [Anaerolineales bacterium]|jgi:GNAT superfamily N-acetyltransferase